MNEDSKTPYANLDPNLILDAIESVGFHCSGSLFALNSYENRVYQVGIEDNSPLIAKFYRPNRWSNDAILEEHQFAAQLQEHEIPVVAPLVSATQQTLHHYHDFRFALFPRRGGHALELDNLEQLEWMGRFIGRLHAIGACHSFQHRPYLNVQTHGYEPFQILQNSHFIPDTIHKTFFHTLESVLKKIEHCFQYVGIVPSIQLHGDFHAGNILWNQTGPQIVDLDDCVMGPAIQDIWMLLSGNREQTTTELSVILRGYREFHDFNSRELFLIEAMRTLRMIQYAAWLAVRWDDPAFPLSFPWFNTSYYWHELLQDLNEQSLLLDKTDEQTFLQAW